MRTIHRITYICITANLKTGGAYYTHVRIIYKTLQGVCGVNEKIVNAAVHMLLCVIAAGEC